MHKFPEINTSTENDGENKRMVRTFFKAIQAFIDKRGKKKKNIITIT